MTPLGELLEACIWFLLAFDPCTFPLLIFLCPLAVINQNHEYDYMLSPVRLPCEPSNLGMVLGTSLTRAF